MTFNELLDRYREISFSEHEIVISLASHNENAKK